MRCPFCGAELIEAGRIPYFICTNNDCKFSWDDMHEQIWQDLIDGKKAQDALFRIRKRVSEIEPSITKSLETCKIACDTLARIKDICESGRYADTLNFNLDSTDIRNIYLLTASIIKKDKE